MDGEVIAIHLGTGMYYSLRGSAAVLWGALDEPNDVAGMAAVLTGQFEVSAEQAGKEVEAFLARLREEQMVVVAETAVPAKPLAPPAERRPFTPPLLERYADLQDLLLLDPIHDVGAQGWPHLPPNPQK